MSEGIRTQLIMDRINEDVEETESECSGYLGMTDCLLSDLENSFPALFGDNKNLLSPGRPTKFHSSINMTERSLILNWQPPLDSSIRDVKGFFITIHGVDGLASGLRQCVIIQLNSPLNATHYNTKFAITYYPVFESSVYDFRIVSLPIADIKYDTNDDSVAARLRTKTGKIADQSSPAHWTTPMTCHSDDVMITAVFSLPPKRFKMTKFDITVVHFLQNRTRLWENSSRISLLDSSFEKLHQLQWRYSSFKEPTGDRIKILIRPVDLVMGLGQCICYNANGICVGGCKQSSCTIVTVSPSDKSPLKNDLAATSRFKDHLLAISTSLSLLLVSMATGFLLFFLRRHYTSTRSQKNPTKTDILPNNHDVTEALTPPDFSLQHQQNDSFYFAGSFDTFLKPSSEMEEGSMTLSEQMLKINENYFKAINRTGSNMSLFADKVSLGGKSV
ncbi:uncharacterized protein LOC133182585 [Saccostrea echinata]|uniref:uncharacterized protein LOC133182585 n=1 Tax=Saccostrea echinata TaxID=191078 RepID=UPI002A83265C|nr:uncharacterized protein LOC133182585 [Saccostrea echinata]